MVEVKTSVEHGLVCSDAGGGMGTWSELVGTRTEEARGLPW
jgi:hypothetical protein